MNSSIRSAVYPDMNTRNIKAGRYALLLDMGDMGFVVVRSGDAPADLLILSRDFDQKEGEGRNWQLYDRTTHIISEWRNILS